MARKILTNYERRIIEAIAATIIPNPHGPFTKSVTDVNIADKVADHLTYLTLDSRLTYRLFLFVMDIGAIFYRLRLKTFTRLKREHRVQYLKAWHKTFLAPKRLISRFIEAIINMNYYSTPEVGAECGYAPLFKKPQPQPEFPHERLHAWPLEGEHDISVDVCVIGSGAGGASAAAELASKGNSVVIIEEGGYFTVENYGKDVVSMTKMLYRDGGVIATFGWPNILLPEGKCVGGTTTINSGTCFRCPDSVLERWDYEFGLSQWRPDKMKAYFDRVERAIGVFTPGEGLLGKNTEVFKRGLKAMGLKGEVIPRNAIGCDGSGVCCFGCPTNAKKSVDLNFIPTALENGAHLYAHARAERLLFSKGKADGVVVSFIHPETKKKIGRLNVRARAVLIACGTLHTPVLLKNSGLPDTSGAIGRNLTLHPAAKVVALFDEEVCASQGIPQGYGLNTLDADGIKLEQIFTPPAYVASSLMMHGVEHSEVMANYNKLAAFGLIVSDTSHGRIFSLPGNRAVIWYSINKHDLPKYIRGIAYLTDIFFAAGAKKVFPCIHRLSSITREEGSEKLYKKKIKPKDLDLQAFHPLGTCRMGADPREAAVDPNGRLYGMDNVFVADGSIFPTSLGVNPQVTIMAAGMKIAEHMDRELL